MDRTSADLSDALELQKVLEDERLKLLTSRDEALAECRSLQDTARRLQGKLDMAKQELSEAHSALEISQTKLQHIQQHGESSRNQLQKSLDEEMGKVCVPLQHILFFSPLLLVSGTC